MLYLPARTLPEAVRVSHLTVNRWIQSGWLKGVDREGRRGPAVGVSAKDVLIEFDSLPRFVEAHPDLGVNLEALRAFAVEQDAAPGAAADGGGKAALQSP
jgi:hypothetical protein